MLLATRHTRAYYCLLYLYAMLFAISAALFSDVDYACRRCQSAYFHAATLAERWARRVTLRWRCQLCLCRAMKCWQLAAIIDCCISTFCYWCLRHAIIVLYCHFRSLSILIITPPFAADFHDFISFSRCSLPLSPAAFISLFYCLPCFSAAASFYELIWYDAYARVICLRDIFFASISLLLSIMLHDICRHAYELRYSAICQRCCHADSAPRC